MYLHSKPESLGYDGLGCNKWFHPLCVTSVAEFTDLSINPNSKWLAKTDCSTPHSFFYLMTFHLPSGVTLQGLISSNSLITFLIRGNPQSCYDNKRSIEPRVNSDTWRRFLCSKSFDKTTHDTCNSVAGGSGLGYFPNLNKTWLVVKPEFLNEATEIFKDTVICITTSGRRYIGAAIGSIQFKETYVKEKVEDWFKELKFPSVLVKREPQFAYATYIFGLSKRWMHLMCTMGDISYLYQPLEDCIKDVFYPHFFSLASVTLRVNFFLSAKYGGLGVFNPTKICPHEFEFPAIQRNP
ncbi:hypothetical protein LOD99_11849 [Oopsacas minuta]|uniref:Uncharacterized protein n=1 Tax=Oopsacas minuta TaxID=111878 RepID=A0AAV7JKV7_9METZ|nr:hypothetical protein LOD99_11849 [Oopsacas minuta]